jgi:hypothetical protein
MPYILCLYLFQYVSSLVQCHVMSCSQSERHWCHWNIALHRSSILVIQMTIIVLLWESGENVCNLKRWGIFCTITWLFVMWWCWSTACNRAIFLYSQVQRMCSGYLCGYTSHPVGHLNTKFKHTRRTHMFGVSSLNAETYGSAKGVVFKWHIHWTLAIRGGDSCHLMPSAKWVFVFYVLLTMHLDICM